MKTIFQCENCGDQYNDATEAERCEAMCRLSNTVCDVLGGLSEPYPERWKPPLLSEMSVWSVADKKELARRVVFCVRGLEDTIKTINNRGVKTQ